MTEIKTVYARTTADKLLIQKDMVELRDEHGWTQPDIARETGIPQQTVSNWLEAFDEATNLGRPSRLTPESVQDASDRRVARRVIAQAPMELVEQMFDELPILRREKIAAAAGHAYAKARVAYDERERNLSPRERSEREAAGEALSMGVRQVAAGFSTLGVVGHLRQAYDDLHEIVSDGALQPEFVREIEAALNAFNAEFEVARALVGLEVE